MGVLDSGHQESVPADGGNQPNGGKISFAQDNAGTEKKSGKGSVLQGSDFQVVPLPLDTNARGWKPKPGNPVADDGRKQVSFGPAASFQPGAQNRGA